MVKKRNYLMCVLLTILTLGLYGFYWLVQITDTVNELAKPDKKTSGIKSLLFELITCGIYIYFWSWKIGIVLDQERSKAGLPPKNLKLLFLIFSFLAWPVSMALMQKEINEISGIPEQNTSLYDVQQNTSNRILRWIISIAGTFAALLFLLVSQILKLGFVQKNGMGKGRGYGIALWIKDTFTYNPFSFSLILAGICILVISCLFLGPCYGGKKSRAVSMVAMTALILLSVSLLINGIYYKPFYMEFRFLSSLFICNIVMISSMLVAGLGAAVFCCLEFMISLSINKLRSVFLAATTAFFGITSVGITVIVLLQHRIYVVPGYLFLFGFPFLLLAISQLSGCMKRNF